MTHPAESPYQNPMGFDRDTPTPMEDDTEALFDEDECPCWDGLYPCDCDECRQEDE